MAHTNIKAWCEHWVSSIYRKSSAINETAAQRCGSRIFISFHYFANVNFVNHIHKLAPLY